MACTDKERKNFIQNLTDAGCSKTEIEKILNAIENGDKKEIESIVEKHRKQLLEQFHQSKQCIDCIDYFTYSLKKKFGGMLK